MQGSIQPQQGAKPGSPFIPDGYQAHFLRATARGVSKSKRGARQSQADTAPPVIE